MPKPKDVPRSKTGRRKLPNCKCGHPAYVHGWFFSRRTIKKCGVFSTFINCGQVDVLSHCRCERYEAGSRPQRTKR